MRYFFDESGDFAFSPASYDVYTQAGVLCPESLLPDIDAYVADRRARWGVDELHAADLTPGQWLHVCRFIAKRELQVVAQAIDSELNTLEDIRRWRVAQAETLERNLAWYRSAGGEAEDIVRWMVARGKSATHDTRISDTDFVQAVVLVDLVHAAFQKSLVAYSDERWDTAFESFTFTIDAKLPGKLAPGEKFLNHGLVPILGSNEKFGIELPESWRGRDVAHPFLGRFERAGGWVASERRHVQSPAIDLNAIFNDALRFETSHVHAGLQLADIAAYVVRSAILRPEDYQAQDAYDLLRPKLRRGDGTTLAVVRLSTARGRGNLRRYEHLSGLI